jgi:hypothetical protein
MELACGKVGKMSEIEEPISININTIFELTEKGYSVEKHEGDIYFVKRAGAYLCQAQGVSTAWFYAYDHSVKPVSNWTIHVRHKIPFGVKPENILPMVVPTKETE